jgi:hypothetical protein
MDEVVVGCPTTHNNSNAYRRATHGRAIYVEAIANPIGGSTHACSSSSSKLIVQVSVVYHHLQDTASPQMLQSGWYKPCSFSDAYHPHDHVLYSSSFYSFSSRIIESITPCVSFYMFQRAAKPQSKAKVEANWCPWRRRDQRWSLKEKLRRRSSQRKSWLSKIQSRRHQGARQGEDTCQSQIGPL